MEFAAAVVIGGLALLATVLWLVRSNSSRRTRLPPVKGGWIPWVGCAIPFGKEPLWFIQRTRKEVSAGLARTRIKMLVLPCIKLHNARDYILARQIHDIICGAILSDCIEHSTTSGHRMT